MGYFELNGEKKPKLNTRRGGRDAGPSGVGMKSRRVSRERGSSRHGSRAAAASRGWGAARQRTGGGAGRQLPPASVPQQRPRGHRTIEPLNTYVTLIPQLDKGIGVSLAPRHRIRTVSCREVLCDADDVCVRGIAVGIENGFCESFESRAAVRPAISNWCRDLRENPCSSRPSLV